MFGGNDLNLLLRVDGTIVLIKFLLSPLLAVRNQAVVIVEKGEGRESKKACLIGEDAEQKVRTEIGSSGWLREQVGHRKSFRM